MEEKDQDKVLEEIDKERMDNESPAPYPIAPEEYENFNPPTRVNKPVGNKVRQPK